MGIAVEIFDRGVLTEYIFVLMKWGGSLISLQNCVERIRLHILFSIYYLLSPQDSTNRILTYHDLDFLSSTHYLNIHFII